MFILNPTLVIQDQRTDYLIEDHVVKLRFHGDSAELCRRVLPVLDHCQEFNELASLSGYSPATLRKFLSILEADNLALALTDLKRLRGRRLITKIRLAATFWNKCIMAHALPTRLFRGEAVREEVLGWGIEFYFFIRAANEYMARGSARISGPTHAISGLWQHYADEALHDGIFLSGLVGCGFTAEDIANRPPLASTLALLNHLYETSEDGALEYAALFAVMQPLTERPTTTEIATRYQFLRDCYPFARTLFDAFERHDDIDASLGHSKLLLEQISEVFEPVETRTVSKLFSIIENTANYFILFFEGILRHYRGSRTVSYRQVPNALAAVHR